MQRNDSWLDGAKDSSLVFTEYFTHPNQPLVCRTNSPPASNMLWRRKRFLIYCFTLWGLVGVWIGMGCETGSVSAPNAHKTGVGETDVVLTSERMQTHYSSPRRLTLVLLSIWLQTWLYWILLSSKTPFFSPSLVIIAMKCSLCYINISVFKKNIIFVYICDICIWSKGSKNAKSC